MQATLEKNVYCFGLKKTEGDATMKLLLGGKGANLADMSKIGLPVPPGFTVTTAQCHEFYKNGKLVAEEVKREILEGVRFIEESIGKGFGKIENPLLVSVRSGAPVSMPGMMDTILNLGLNDETVAGLAKKSANERFAYDSYRRFIQMYSNVVLGINHHYFEEIIDQIKLTAGVTQDADLNVSHLKSLVEEYKVLVLSRTQKAFPQDVYDQLFGAISAVFESWMNDRAIYYRKMSKISEALGTAVTVQSMVFGNMGDNSGTGVAFTRNPSNGQKHLYGEYLLNAQGEDVVAGIRTPGPINTQSALENDSGLPSLEDSLPEVYKEFVEIANLLENHYKDMQDIEFTIENSRLFILQTRSGKRTARAAVKVAIDLIKEGLIDEKTALLRVDANSLNVLLHKTLDPKKKTNIIDKGLPASPGAASGVIAFSPEAVKNFSARSIPAILTRVETSPEDIEGMNIAVGILTSRGGMTSHAAVVARGMGKTCVTSARTLVIDYKSATLKTKTGQILKEGDYITIDGSTGEVFAGVIEGKDPEIFDEFKQLMVLAAKYKKNTVRTNAETPLDSQVARNFGAEGIGLCRTEHMFFEKSRILHVREMILSDTHEARLGAIEKVLPFQRQDFIDIFKVMEGLPVNIRLLDPPLHEFLPQKQSDIEELAAILKMDSTRIQARLKSLHEQNPMLGHRGCRLGVTYPEIYEMQVRAIFEAAEYVVKEGLTAPLIEIMIPFIISKEELDFFDRMVKMIAVSHKAISYQLGTMIEIPRAAIMAGEIAKTAQYFSFGTNDLTQTTLGISRDDAGSFVNQYVDAKLIKHDPFQVLDREGVGFLIKMACERGREVRSDIKLGICGEHGGDPESIAFCLEVGLDYVSCSPYRVPIAILASAQASIKLGS